jgi:5'-3' exoribonuclease 1
VNIFRVSHLSFLTWFSRCDQEKLGWGLDNEEELRKLAENYVEGLQWVLFYYYRGVASWPWYYRYHYSPRISGSLPLIRYPGLPLTCVPDIHKGLKANLNFKLGRPFKPFEQLMGVLPDRSKKIVPEPYHV